jgi:murein DD-endopeptidase MepM/ murein hydrolase activator NlpD
MGEKEQQIGRSGRTGMALGDHLHFTMLVNGQMVNPVEWWDSHWIQDRILRKLQAVGGAATAPEH